ncbi:hypothetical protein G6F43_010527 [Rhizopus delemar]|nr:hypothetical protein G6F43_010527 [Rhizopus delemar]
MGQSTTATTDETNALATSLTSSSLLPSEATSSLSSTLSSTTSITTMNTAKPSTTTDYSSSPSIAFSPQPTVQGTGWDPSGNSSEKSNESWLKTHNRFVFIIFIGLIVIGLILWYIIKSVKGMRKRLKEENEAHLYMMQQQPPSANTAAAVAAPRPIPDNHECATPVSPPPAYKFDDHPNNNTNQQ